MAQSVFRVSRKWRSFFRAAVFRSLVGDRIFSGTVVITDPTEARKSDHVRLRDIDWNTSAVFWADGSLGFLRGYSMGAGVAWIEGSKWITRAYTLGQHKGLSEDGELFAIYAALLLAAERLLSQLDLGIQTLKLVRVFTDSLGILQSLSRGTCPALGPLIPELGTFAVQHLFEDVDWLVEHGVKVELVWVKGHSKSEGNRMANQAAGSATQIYPFTSMKRRLKEEHRLSLRHLVINHHSVMTKTSRTLTNVPMDNDLHSPGKELDELDGNADVYQKLMTRAMKVLNSDDVEEVEGEVAEEGTYEDTEDASPSLKRYRPVTPERAEHPVKRQKTLSRTPYAIEWHMHKSGT